MQKRDFKEYFKGANVLGKDVNPLGKLYTSTPQLIGADLCKVFICTSQLKDIVNDSNCNQVSSMFTY